MHYYDFNIAAYASATAHLSLEEDICYRRLLDRYYDTERPIENDPAMISRKVRINPDVVASVLAEFFFLVDGCWHNRRADEEIARWYEKSNKARQSADARWAKQRINADALRSNSERNANALRTHCEGNATYDQVPMTHEKTTTTRAARFDAAALLSSLGVDCQIAKDWLQHRKTLKTAVSQTVIDGIGREAAKAGISLSAALSMTCERGWRGFKAEWLEERKPAAKHNGYRSRADALADTARALTTSQPLERIINP
jgi:uncharacterized protein YdaU (DUF1376 family)